MTARLPEDLARAFERDGFFRIDGFAGAATTEAMLRRIVELAREEAAGRDIAPAYILRESRIEGRARTPEGAVSKLFGCTGRSRCSGTSRRTRHSSIWSCHSSERTSTASSLSSSSSTRERSGPAVAPGRLVLPLRPRPADRRCGWRSSRPRWKTVRSGCCRAPTASRCIARYAIADSTRATGTSRSSNTKCRAPFRC